MISRKYPSTRLRRLRQSESIIDLTSECAVTKNDLIQPVFVKEGLSDKEPIESMPGIFRFGEDSVLKEIEEINQLGIRAIAIFPVIDPSKKDSKGTEATKRDNFISRVLGSIKSKFPEMLVIADVALDPYTDHGHDGILENDEILNDQTLDVLAEQSLVLAEAGAYAAKYNSKFYGPFRDAVNSKNNLGTSDKSSYQMNPANSLEALNEVAMDIEEGADIVMVKPGMPYLDIISKIKEEFKVPTFAYQVSGEYAMIMESVNKGWLDKGVIIESLTSFKRAGADAVLTYFAKDLIKEFNL